MFLQSREEAISPEELAGHGHSARDKGQAEVNDAEVRTLVGL